jgi:hypothetical protein
MSSISGAGSNATGVLGTGYVNLGSAGMCGSSPDGLLEYCEMQTDSLNTQINSLMQQQYAQLNQEQAVESVQTALENFGSSGPQSATQYAQCIAAFNQGIADLPAGDPVAAQPQTQLATMEGQYGVPGTLTTAQQTTLQADQGQASNPMAVGAQETVNSLTTLQKGSFVQPTGSDWTATTDALSNLASNIKSNAQIQMLDLQDLLSQQQAALTLGTNMMQGQAQTTLGIVKNIT